MRDCMAKFIRVSCVGCNTPQFPKSLWQSILHQRHNENSISSLTVTLATNRQRYVQTTELITGLTTSKPWLRKNKVGLRIFRQQQSVAVTWWVYIAVKQLIPRFPAVYSILFTLKSNHHLHCDNTGMCSSKFIKIEKKKPVTFCKHHCQYSLLDRR
jgi:urate oxidase